MRPIPTRAPDPEPHRRHPASTTLVHATLDDQTLLALMLGRADPDIDPDRLAAALLERFGTLGAVAVAPPGELARAPGVGSAAVADLKLLRELAIRLAREEACQRPVITSWTALVAYVRTALAHEPREQLHALYLDRCNCLIRDELVADDPTVQAAVDRRIERLLDATAARIVAGRHAREPVSTGPADGPTNGAAY